MIYAIQAGEGGPIKIGFAEDVRSRMSSLQTGCPVRLTLLGTCEVSDDRVVEQHIHKMNRAFRMSGEWFVPGWHVMETVEEIKAGTLDQFVARDMAEEILRKYRPQSDLQKALNLLSALVKAGKWKHVWEKRSALVKEHDQAAAG